MFSPSLVFKTSIIEQRNRVLFVNSWSVRHPTSPGRIIAHYSPSRVLGGVVIVARANFENVFPATALLATPIEALRRRRHATADGEFSTRRTSRRYSRPRRRRLPRARPASDNTVKPNYCIQHYILVQTAHALPSQPPKIYCYLLILRQV